MKLFWYLLVRFCRNFWIIFRFVMFVLWCWILWINLGVWRKILGILLMKIWVMLLYWMFWVIFWWFVLIDWKRFVIILSVCWFWIWKIWLFLIVWVGYCFGKDNWNWYWIIWFGSGWCFLIWKWLYIMVRCCGLVVLRIRFVLFGKKGWNRMLIIRCCGKWLSVWLMMVNCNVIFVLFVSVGVVYCFVGCLYYYWYCIVVGGYDWLVFGWLG